MWHLGFPVTNVYNYLRNRCIDRSDYLGLDQVYFTVEFDFVRAWGLTGGFTLVVYDSNNDENIGLYKTIGQGIGYNKGYGFGVGYLRGHGTVEGSSWNADINMGKVSPTASIPQSSDLNYLAVQLTYGKGSGASVGEEDTESVFTLNTLKGHIYRFLYEGHW